MNAAVWEAIRDEAGGIGEVEPVGGGCIHHAGILTLRNGQKVFIKTNEVDKFPLLDMESMALMLLRKTGEVLVPEPLSCGTRELGSGEEFCYLMMNYLPLVRGRPAGWRNLGKQLAALHRHTSEDGRFGFYRDNFIGATAQPDDWGDDWAKFFIQRRLGYQFELEGNRFEHAEKLIARVPDLLGGHSPAPSLLHGDLWGGNIGFTPLGTPVIFDPATYYGDRETDLAFSEMFGGFAPEFYSGYRSVYPLEDGYETRRDLYNLYHVLNHHHLFGGSYGQQAEAMIRRLLVGF